MKKGRYYKTHYLGGRSSKEKKEIDAFLMDDSTLKTFQKNALRLFDLPHHREGYGKSGVEMESVEGEGFGAFFEETY